MAKAGELDWTHLYKTGHVNPEHPLSRLVSKAVTGADVAHEALATGSLPVLIDAPKQPTREEFLAAVAKMLPTPEQLEKAERDWENRFVDHFKAATQNIDHLNKSYIGSRKWEPGKSFNDLLTDEEKAERQMYSE